MLDITTSLRRYPDRWAALALLLLCLLIFARVFAMPGSSIYGGDLDYFLGQEIVNRQALAQGELPLWNPYTNAGMPGLANPQQGLLYPPAWPARLLSIPPLLTLNLGALLHLWLCGLGFYLFLRAEGLQPLAALGGALACAFGSAMIPRLMPGHVTWMRGIAWPGWVMWALRGLLHTGGRMRLRWGLALAAFAALMGLAGHPQQTLLFTGLFALYGLWWLGALLRAGEAPSALKGLTAALLVGLLAAGLMAMQWLPALELLSFSERGQSFSVAEINEYASRLYQWHSLILPTLFYSTRTGITIGIDNSILGSATAGFHYTNFPESSLYLGLGALALAGCAAFGPAHPRRGLARLLLGFGALGLLLTLGNQTPLYRLLTPVLSIMRAPARFSLWWLLGAGLSAAYGLEAISQRLQQKERPALRLPLALALGGSLIGAALCLGWFLWVAPSTAGLRLPDPGVIMRDAVDLALISFSLVSLLWLAGLLLIRRQPGERWLPLLTALIAAEMLLFAWPLTRPQPAASYYLNPASPLDSLSASPESQRITQVLQPRSGLSYGLPFVTESEPFALARSLDLIRGGDSGLDLLAVTARFDALNERIAPRESPWPRLYAAPAVQVERRPGIARALLYSGAFDPWELALVEDPALLQTLPTEAPRGEFRGQITDYGINHLHAEVSSDAPVMVVFSETWYPGWQARIDGLQAPIYRVNTQFRGLVVEPGTHEIDMHYQPGIVSRGAWISAGSLLLALVLGLVSSGSKTDAAQPASPPR